MAELEVQALKAKIDAMTPAEKLKFAGMLLEAGKPELAHTIAERVVLELGAALALKMVSP